MKSGEEDGVWAGEGGGDGAGGGTGGGCLDEAGGVAVGGRSGRRREKVTGNAIKRLRSGVDFVVLLLLRPSCSTRCSGLTATYCSVQQCREPSGFDRSSILLLSVLSVRVSHCILFLSHRRHSSSNLSKTSFF